MLLRTYKNISYNGDRYRFDINITVNDDYTIKDVYIKQLNKKYSYQGYVPNILRLTNRKLIIETFFEEYFVADFIKYIFDKRTSNVSDEVYKQEFNMLQDVLIYYRIPNVGFVK